MVYFEGSYTRQRSTCGRFRIWTQHDTQWFAADMHGHQRVSGLTYDEARAACEAWIAPRVPQTLTVTTAPACFDYEGFGTFEVEVLGVGERGETFRVVSTGTGSPTETQRDRYQSGLYMASSLEDFEKIRPLLITL